MTPTPQDPGFIEQDVQSDGERVVISGMAGLYPQSYNVKDLSDILYHKKNPLTPESLRFKYKHPEVVECGGSVPDLDRFDAQFFKVHYRLSNSMDSMSRKILEQTFQAIYDAGISPEQISGKKIGVYVGTCFSETEKACFYDVKTRSGFGIAGCSKSMFANRISYWLNAKGPSMSIDEACCSSTAALEQAYQAIRRGECEGAVVGGAYLCLHPQSSVHFGRTMQLSRDGKTKSFAENADGCAISEAINVLFLQKAKDALRIYADVVYAKCEFISKLQGETGQKYGFYREPGTTANFLKKFYEEAKVSPNAVEYVEAFGTGVPEADKSELYAIDEVFCQDRNTPLLVGSVMSNIGYNEAASGIAAVTKVLLGYHRGELAANLHCSEPRRDVAALRERRMRVLTDHHRFGHSYAAVNGMSVTGVNAHVLLHGHHKHKDPNRYKSSIPHLVTISARQESSVTKILNDLKSRPIDPEELALLHNIHQNNISGHLGRGYIILDTTEEQKTVSVCEKAAYFNDARRPLWFVYSGMGSQWAGMGTQLMRVPIFAAAIERCRQALEPKGVDILKILTTPDEKIYDNILHSFVGIAACQIGLTDILRELGLVPDGIIGHSVGELGCAYADGCLTAEEMILSAYSRGLVSLQTPFIRGSMAAVGLGYQEVVKMCPPEIEVACHNGPDSSTISGPADVMRTFVSELTAKGVFAKEVPCSNIAYHSRYIAEAGPGLLKYLTEVIKEPRPRSDKWISTSVPQDRWNDPLAKYSSAEYHTNNLLNPVLFEETSRLIPSNAVLVEVAPHGLLQAILKRSLSPECVNIPLTRRKHVNNTHVLLEAIGKLYMDGYNPKIQIMYPKVEFPVSTGTPLLSHLVEWAHGEKWPIPLYRSARRNVAAACNFVISLYDKENAYLRGNVIRGQTLYPYAAALVAVWDTLAMTVGAAKKRLSVDFRDVQLHAQPPLHNQRPLRLAVSLHRGNGYFEVIEETSKVASGYIYSSEDSSLRFCENIITKTSSVMDLTAEDIYQLFEDRDYSYSDEFRSIDKASTSLDEAQLLWKNNWVTLIDGILQLNALRQPHDGVSTPALVKRISINIEKHIQDNADKKAIHAEIFDQYDFTRCGGVLMENIKFENLPPVNTNEMKFDNMRFMPNFQTDIDISTSLLVYLQTISQNLNKDTIKIVGLTNYATETSIFKKLQAIIASADMLHGIKVKYQQLTVKNHSYVVSHVDVIVVQNLSSDDNLCHLLYRLFPQNKFVLSEEERVCAKNRPSALYRILSTHSRSNAGSPSRLDLIRWKPSSVLGVTNVVTVRIKSDFAYLSSAHEKLGTGDRLLVFAAYPPPAGLKKLVGNWKNERNSTYLIMADDINFAMDNMSAPDLKFSVLKDGKWGVEYCAPEHGNTSINITLQCKQIGDYNSLTWVEAPEPTGSGINVTVEYAGIHNPDYKKAGGVIPLKLDSENNFGMDYSGTTESGERVMGIVPGGACSARVRALPHLLWPVPAHWTLEDAATVPLAYAHAFYCLVIKGVMNPGASILVLGGTGTLGQAVISIALAHGCRVFTTVSNIQKKRFLLKLFPDLKEEYIGNSRDHSFRDMVRSATDGCGCELIISTSKKDLKDTSLSCGGFLGILIDLVQIHDNEKYIFGMGQMIDAKSYFVTDFSSIFSNGVTSDMKLQLLISEGIARGYVRPLSRVTYAPREAARGFKLLAASRHRGRVLLRMRDHLPRPQPRVVCIEEHCHIVLSGEGTLGLHLADRLVARGARNLYIHCKIPEPAILNQKLRSWKKLGVNIVRSSEELKTETEVSSILNSALRLGPIEGVYVMADAKQRKYLEALLTNLDTQSRKLCPNMKYFAVISDGDPVGQEVCYSRTRDQLPAIVVTLPDKNEDVWAYRSAWRRCAVDVVERVLRSSCGVLQARTERAAVRPVLEQLAEITGMKLPKDADPDTTLKDLCIDDDTLKLISTFLKLHLNIDIDDEKLPLVTINKIRSLDGIRREIDFKPVDELATFYNHVDTDELLATTEMVVMPTLTTGASMRDDEFDVSQTYLCIVPGLEGHHARFRVLCERLKLPALVLQPGLDCPRDTPTQLAHKYAEVLLSKAGLKNNFYLLGYESGIFVTLEIAAILEDKGLTGTIFCLGCTPDEFHLILKEKLAKFTTKEQLEDAIVRHMFTLMAGDDTGVLEDALGSVNTWSEKVDACVRTLLGRVSHSAQYTRALIESALARIVQAKLYTAPARALRSKLVLLRAASVRSALSAPSAQSAPADLQAHSQQPVVVHQLSAPIAHSATDLQCTAIINQHLDPALLEEFYSKNTCETYLLNPGSFMTTNEDD